jgi:hypothetical protein
VADLLLLHELGIGAIVDNVLAKDGSGQNRVDVLGVDVLELSVQNKVVALSADVDGGLLAEQDKGVDVAVLFPVLLKEARGVHAIGDGAAHDGEPGKDHGRFIGVLEQQLLRDVPKDGEEEEGSRGDANLRRGRKSRQPLGEGPGEVFKETHDCRLLLARSV